MLLSTGPRFHRGLGHGVGRHLVAAGKFDRAAQVPEQGTTADDGDEQGKGQENSPTEQDPSARYVKIKIVCTQIVEDSTKTPTVKVFDEKDVLIQSFRLVKPKNIEIKIPPIKTPPVKRTTKTHHKKFKLSNCKAIAKSLRG